MSESVPLLQNYIGGRWQPAKSGATFENRNPATGAVLHEVAGSGAADVAEAAAAAEAAYPKWRAMPAPKRGEILFRVAELLRDRKQQLARELCDEMGKVMPESLGDVQEGIDMTFYMAGEGRRQFGETVPSELPNKWAMSVRMPVGVIGAITPWNFPMAIPTWKLMPALISGNTAVFKPSEYSPRSAWNLVKLFEEAGLPPGVLNVVFGQGAEPGAAVVDDPRIRLISFTGSNAVGTGVGKRCGELGKSCHLEMGGKNAIIIMDDADLELALEGVVWSAFGTSGQRCTAASRVIVHRRVEGQFAEMLVKRAQGLRLGPGWEASTDVGPVINPTQLKKIESYMPVGVSEGARIATGGHEAHPQGFAGGYFFEPTVFTGARGSMRIAQEEIFGPVTTLIAVDSLDEAIEVNNNVPYGLSSAIYTRDVNQAFRAMERLTTGIVYVNAGTIGAEIQLPFGGTRGTGNGHREAGRAALDTYTEWKTIYVDYSGRLQRAQIDTN
ncbi:MAG TPA: aldehyde dehydrogenase family protein [Dehalococcoidia bacterium]|nr:aldehyde dehydrogenase family protein [Dehalococcoidia bacterium]